MSRISSACGQVSFLGIACIPAPATNIPYSLLEMRFFVRRGPTIRKFELEIMEPRNLLLRTYIRSQCHHTRHFDITKKLRRSVCSRCTRTLWKSRLTCRRRSPRIRHRSQHSFTSLDFASSHPSARFNSFPKSRSRTSYYTRRFRKDGNYH